MTAWSAWKTTRSGGTKLYLYYAQMGRCMYTGERIDLGQLLSSEALYDIDHIYPQSRVKDDSIDNRVLVKRTVNEKKTNIYPLEAEIVRRQSGFWKMLMDKGLISKKKYERLTRRTGFSDDELMQFAARQLVETRQSSRPSRRSSSGCFRRARSCM